ncbi:DUF1003 domain-containing protein [Geothrix paludis]|uniref:DUF1003 domain-containing protein n=1 Tax=Geothrix paludis TaxID=2922722 RepID=UPI001FACAE2D|nr:DUF1003 domain-containing protein [Geothrix paludis]
MSTTNRTLGPAAQYRHDHPPVKSVNEEVIKSMTLGQRVADRVALSVGSWPFIIVQSVLLCVWMGFNVYLVVQEHSRPGFLKAWDPYPFILLNLVLSFQAAYTGPVVMMSQNRQSEKDRLAAQNDYEVNKKSEVEIEVIMKHLVHQDKLLLDAIARIESLQNAPDQGAVARIDELLKRMDQNDRNIAALLARLA